ncbi:MAG: glycolate oxidase subunit GlcF [Gammaproteobacteria bacterium]|nr:glycolate oxidase subunit GlcF [Gammaproteobacteria bacterium]MDH5651044.1 glycolate oxidase subunit GlcF [Gammaproteobacteria bacterium]
MQTQLADNIKNTAAGQTADTILRRCVHCGFCTATCPTYQLLGDELDGPRGRIYLIKQLLEGKQVSRKTQTHLDRCLTCRSCETTCPSGVEYSHLLDIGREILAQRVRRPVLQTLLRKLLGMVLPNRTVFGALVRIGYTVRAFLPKRMRNTLQYAGQVNTPWRDSEHKLQVILLDACAQADLAPNINLAAARVLDKLGMRAIRLPHSCCGALPHHMTEEERTLRMIKTNIDHWWPQLNSNVKYIVSTASGCGVMVKDYGRLLKDDEDYAERAALISARCRDIVEVIAEQDLTALQIDAGRSVAVHTPCTLQHGQKLNTAVDNILQRLGFDLCAVKEAHLCCGSAGTYSILQPKISQQLLQNKLQALNVNRPQLIVTANIGCLLHLQSGSNVPVKHWIELLDSPAG